MREATENAIAYARHQHAAAKFITEPEELCRLWNIRVILGRDNRATHGPPSVITRTPDSYAPRQRFTILHEVAHVLIQRAGLEDDIKAEVDDDDGDYHLEMVANHIGAMLLMPDNLIEAVIKKHGMTPLAILEIQAAARASFAAASRRFVGAHVDAPTTVFLSGESYVLDVASTDPYNRLYRYDRMPDARARFPEASILSLPDRARPRTIGVIVQ